MGILSDIFHKIFPSSHPANTAQRHDGGPGSMQSTSPAQSLPSQGMPPPAAGHAIPMVDVEDILNRMAASAGQPLHWRSSIVDLLKLLHLDSSLQARQSLAREMDYKGDMGDSAAMNVWLHRQLMNRLAANGGKVPEDLRD